MEGLKIKDLDDEVVTGEIQNLLEKRKGPKPPLSSGSAEEAADVSLSIEKDSNEY
jgi:hypothetical protein